MATLSESKTLAEIASEYRVHPTEFTRWKQELIENASDLFGKGKKKEVNHEAEVAELHRTAKIARLNVRIYEVGISYSGRTYAEGKKIGWKDGISALWCIVKYNLI